MPCTPYVHHADPKKPHETKEALYTPPSREALQTAKPDWHVYIITMHAYPDEDTTAATFLGSRLRVRLSQGRAGKQNRIGRTGDSEYMSAMTRNVRHRVLSCASQISLTRLEIFVTASGVRSHIVTVARAIVEREFQLRHTANALEKDNLRRRVQELLTSYAFTCTDDQQV